MDYAEKDIYSDDGVLLLSKGEELTAEINRKLKRMKSLTFRDSSSPGIPPSLVQQGTDLLKSHFKAIDEKLIDDSAGILNKILFDSRNQPWWLLVNTFSNYIDWLYTHSINVTLLSEMIAMSMGLPKKQIDSIALGALLHDIGKMMIPKKIIQKAGKLTNEEFSFIKQHCELGYSMVKDYKLGNTVRDIILQHHERLDGSGYPYGLKAEQIPVHSRIVMLADILDAMTSYRPYKSSKEIYSALQELRQDGSKYPLEIVEIVESLVK